jgi:hypothetical protein
MHLDTVFSFCDRDLVTIFPEVVNQIVPFTLRPTKASPAASTSAAKKSFLDVVAEALKPKKLRVVETGGNSFAAEREQWDDGNNVVASNRAWSSATTATPTPTPCCARPASRSSPSAPANSAVAVAAATA